MKIITIDRLYGAGGHTVGREVAKRLGIEFYDRDIIRTAVAASGATQDEVEEEEEELSRVDSFIKAINPNSFDIKDVVFENEKAAILELAQKGPSVILGRCASAILEEAGIETLSVFLHASREDRMAAVGRLIGSEDRAEILACMKKMDHKRRYYYEYYTPRRWANGLDYDLFLNSHALGYEGCINTIVAIASQQA